VSPANAVRLAACIRQRGGCARAIIYQGLDHVGIVLALALDRFNIAPVLEDVLRFAWAPAASACRGSRSGDHS